MLLTAPRRVVIGNKLASGNQQIDSPNAHRLAAPVCAPGEVCIQQLHFLRSAAMRYVAGLRAAKFYGGNVEK